MRFLLKAFIYLFFYLFTCQNIFGQWEIIVTKIPASTPSNASIYIAGNFNNWNPGQNNFKLIKNLQGQWTITLTFAPGIYQFKFTRGSWNTVEGNKDGKVIGNRSYQYTGGKKTLELEIEGWEDSQNPGSTASPNVSVLSEDFLIPQLGRARKIWIYLPPDYTTSNKRYPVIYMHDGQNLFDRATSFAGEWRVDETLDSLSELNDHGCIVVGIENGGEDRIDEYAPWSHPTYGGGYGHAYLSFIEETLKPYVDEHYRTLSSKNFTAIAGSSLGGLISHYAGIRFQNTFGRIGSLSPSFWFSDSIYSIIQTTNMQENTRFYLSSGTDESTNQVLHINRMADTLVKYGLKDINLHVSIVNGGKHNEYFWAKEFPLLYQWFWSDEDFTTNTENSVSNQLVFAYRFGDTIKVQSDAWEGRLYTIYSETGQELQRGVLEEFIRFPADNYVSPYLFSVFEHGKMIYSKMLP